MFQSLSRPTETNVTIAGTVCAIKSESETEIVCRTGAHTPSEKTFVRVDVTGMGVATQVGLLKGHGPISENGVFYLNEASSFHRFLVSHLR